MKKEPLIRVGLITRGEPELRKEENETIVYNSLIGDGFHWEKVLPLKVEGEIEMLETPQGKIHCINILPIEKYLESVAGSEMNPSAPEEFLKAHAVISRSWAYRKLYPGGEIEKPDNDFMTWEESDCHTGFNVCNDDHCQRYQGIQENAENVISAVKKTRGEILTDKDGEVADARFSKCCGGKTEIFSTCWADKDFEYLQSFEDPWCDLSMMSETERHDFLNKILKNYDRPTTDFRNWEEEISGDFISEKIKERYGMDVGEIMDIEKVSSGPSGRIKSLTIKGSRQTIEIGKELPIRRLLSNSCLYSSWFDIEKRGKMFRLTGRGWGHGVGLCQIGAARMAHEGKTYREILEFYYPGTEIKKIYE